MLQSSHRLLALEVMQRNRPIGHGIFARAYSSVRLLIRRFVDANSTRLERAVRWSAAPMALPEESVSSIVLIELCIRNTDVRSPNQRIDNAPRRELRGLTADGGQIGNF